MAGHTCYSTYVGEGGFPLQLNQPPLFEMKTLTETDAKNLSILLNYLNDSCEEIKTFLADNYDCETGEEEALKDWQNRDQEDSAFYNSIVAPILELNQSVFGEEATALISSFFE